MATSAINVNVDTQIKEKATSILKDLGLNMSTFINIALTQVVKKDGIPFEIVNPKPSSKVQVPRYTNREDLKKALLSND